MSALTSPRSQYRRRTRRKARARVHAFRAKRTRVRGTATNRSRKLELMEQARRAGWRGKTYHSAKKFERSIQRWQAARAKL